MGRPRTSFDDASKKELDRKGPPYIDTFCTVDGSARTRMELRFLPFNLRNCYSYFYEFGDRWHEGFVFGAGDDFIL